jgi:hypothetical protein
MYVYLEETVRLGLDCCAAISADYYIVYGWVMTPAGEEVEVRVSGADGDHKVGYHSNHARDDVHPPSPDIAVVNGFTLTFTAHEIEKKGAVLSFSAGGSVISVDLRDPGINTDLVAVTASRNWAATFQLLQHSAEYPQDLPVLGHGGEPLGIFAEWMPKVPLQRSRTETFFWVGALQATASPAGEICVRARLSRSFAKAEVSFVAMMAWQSDEHGLTELRLPQVLGRMEWQGGTYCCAYGRIGMELMARPEALELVVQVTCDGERVWLRCGLDMLSVPAFLDSLGGRPAAGAPGASDTTMLQTVLKAREAAFLPARRETPRLPQSPRGGKFRAIILGVDDLHATRLLHVARRDLRSMFDHLHVVGHAGAQAAQDLDDGDFHVVGHASPSAALRSAMGIEEPVVAVEVSDLGTIMIDGRLPDLARNELSLGDLAQLVTLHAVAGGSMELADSLERLMQFRRMAVMQGWQPVSHQWQNPAVGTLINTHLERIWKTFLGVARNERR